MGGEQQAQGLLVAVGAPSYAEVDPGTDPVPVPDRDLLLTFDAVDDTGLPLLDALGTPDVVGAVSSVFGGVVTAGPDRSAWGHSLRMAGFVPDQPAAPAVLVVRPVAGAADRTEPGVENFAFGADFLLDSLSGVSSTDNGDNLVQRGLVGPNAQYKIQLDGGYPLCRVRGSEGAVAVRATEPVAAQQWNRVRCRRVGERVILRVVTVVDSLRQVREYVKTGATGSLSYPDGQFPFAIGGKVDQAGDVLADDSDQFNGLIDDVVFRHLA